jgi:hypothetical protein
MHKVDLPNSFMHPADEAGQRTETVRIFRATMDASQWHHTIVQKEPDVSWLL